ncbi:MAG TPA: holo-ACP synthase [Candidatus Acidoferrales bacterium]|jgi:holo-[acyl-carrier protein] synthase|nr:holo-ACP synthase [Candidatus Acidoferrales bacterium]
MIVGLGIDITGVDRIEAAIARRGRALLKRLFTPSEIIYCERHRNRAERFAGRFAAKEATMKALGTGWACGVRWIDIEVVREPSGKPTLKLSGATRAIADRLGVKNIALTITHDGNTAMAQVIFES